MVHLVEALRYEPEVRWFGSPWASLEFLIDLIRPAGLWIWSRLNLWQKRLPGISLGKVEGKGGRCLGLTTLPPSCADCLEIWEPQLPGILRATQGLHKYCCTLLTLTSSASSSHRKQNYIYHRYPGRSLVCQSCLYGGSDKSLARHTSQCILFDVENISFDASLVIYIVISFLQLWL
jgi:hypothetical protein